VNPWPWRDPEFRRDLWIVVGLFALGLILQLVAGVVVFWVLEQLGWLDVAHDFGLVDLRSRSRSRA
jgi:hypothetical protein